MLDQTAEEARLGSDARVAFETRAYGPISADAKSITMPSTHPQACLGE